jgi:hypothetical protein
MAQCDSFQRDPPGERIGRRDDEGKIERKLSEVDIRVTSEG